MNVSAFLQRLSTSERILVSLLLAVLLVIGLYTLVLEPLVHRQAEMKRQIGAKQNELAAVQKMRRVYMNLLQESEVAARSIPDHDPSFPMLQYIENTVLEVVDRSKIKSMDPQNRLLAETYREDSVDLRLEGLELRELVQLMYKLEKESDRPLRITRQRVKKDNRDPYQFDVSITVSLLTRVEPAEPAEEA